MGPMTADLRRFLTLRFRWTVVLAAGVLLLFSGLLASDLPSHIRLIVSDLGLVGGGLIAATACGRRSVNSSGRRRQLAWRLSAMAMAMATLGNLCQLLVDMGALPPGARLVPNVSLVIAMLLGVVGMTIFPTVRRRGTELIRMILDGSIVGGSVLFIASVTLFPQLLMDAEGSTFDRAMLLLLPIGDVLLATLGVLLFLRGTRALALVSLGFVLYATSDIIYAVLAVQGPFSFGSPADMGWIGGYAAIALAALHPSASGMDDEENAPEPSAVPATLVIFGLFLAAGAVRLTGAIVGSLNPVAVAMWLAVLLAVASRQILLIVDNEGLRQGLERRVADRTAELGRSVDSNRLLLASVGDGIYGVDRDGLVTFVNPAASATLGYSADQLIGRLAHDAFHAPQEDGSPFPIEGCYVTEAIRSGISAQSEEDRYVTSGGRTFPVEVTASPLTDETGTSGAVVVFRDVTQRREVDRMKSEFVSVVSHELRTPLTSIRGSLGLLSGGALGSMPEPASKLIKIAVDSSERLTRMINDILDIERMESGTMPLDLAEHQAADLIGVAVEQLQIIAADADVRLVVGETEGRIRADGDFTVRTLINLIGNAIKFSPPGEAVSVDARSDGDWVEFHVDDHGRGIPADKLDAVFGRFEQIDSSDAREKGGSGLGLAISRSFVERHGGRIWVTSDEGRATRFSFTLPAVGAPPAPSLSDHPTVLVCDDDEQVVTVLCALLERRGYRAVGVTRGDDAIQRAVELHPAIVLLDLMMPGTDGAEVMAALRAREETRDIPVVFISGLAPDQASRLAAETAGWMVKPVDEGQLLQTIGAALDGHGSRGEVLMVEDDEDLAAVVRTLLERDGLTVHHAHTGQEALDYCADGEPQLLLLDLALPDSDGSEVVSVLRRSGRLADIPLVVYTAADVGRDERDRLHLGDTVFLTKGRVSPEQLEERVLELVDRAAGRDFALD